MRALLNFFTAAAISATIFGCATGNTGTAQLPGTAWQLEDISGTGVIDRAQATLEFMDDGKIGGRGSCNRFFGSAKMSGSSITFSTIGATRMACPEAVMNQETRYFQALQNAERYAIEGDFLLIYSKGAQKPLRFERIKSADQK